MDYKKIYSDLIGRGLKRTKINEVYVERHHIIPRCIGGDDSSKNLVYLTAREHFIAHMLLCKIHPTETKLLYALNMMTLKYTKARSRNRLYGAWKEKLAVAFSEDRKGSKNHFFGKKHSDETKNKIRIKAIFRPPMSPETIAKIQASRKGYKPTVESRKKAVETRRKNGFTNLREETKEKISQTKSLQPLSLKQKGGLKNKGRIQSDDERRKRSEILKGKNTGGNNSQFGKFWITNGTVNKLIANSLTMPEGWYKGRTCPPLGPRNK
jgi:hypothetical protein